jgi:hypothetical protein
VAAVPTHTCADACTVKNYNSILNAHMSVSFRLNLEHKQAGIL